MSRSGEFHLSVVNVGATDVSVPGYTSDLTVSRSASTYGGTTGAIYAPGAAVPTATVFGPAWTAALDGPDAGVAGSTLIDSTAIDGSIALVGPDGDADVYLAPSTPAGARRTTDTLTPGTYVPADPDTAAIGATLTVAGPKTATIVTYKDADGTQTIFTAQATTATGVAALFAPTSVIVPGGHGTVSYIRDTTTGLVTHIVAPTAAGITCSASTSSATPLLTQGCRSLRIVYGAATTATASAPGDILNQVKAIYLDVTGPNASSGTDTLVASYLYDVNKRLVSVTDPRPIQDSPPGLALTTSYTYDGSSYRLASVTPPGQIPYTFVYGPSPDFKLNAVTRVRPTGDPTGGTATLGSYVYNIGLATTGIPDLGTTSAGLLYDWGQQIAPTYAAAVFGADHPVTGTPASTDWPYANLYWTDPRGYTVNTGSYGAGAWRLTSTAYDSNGNITRQLDPAAIDAIAAGHIHGGAGADQLSTQTAYSADGTEVTDVWGPARMVTLTDGTLTSARPHIRTTYDENAPAGGPYRLPTTVITAPANPSTGADLETPRAAKYAYDATGSDGSGWTLGMPTKTTTVIDGNTKDLVSITRYDTDGHVIETRQPESTTGTDAGTRITTLWTANTNPTVPTCGGHPEWAGLPCQVAPADGPNSAVPTITTTYNALLQPWVVTETAAAGAVARTTTTTYLADGRVDTQTVATTGLSGSTAVAGTDTNYDPNTGLATAVVKIGGGGVQQTTGYDQWGRVTSYTPDDGSGTTTTKYNAAGEILSVADPKGTSTWTYDGNDAKNLQERRGLPTGLTVSNPNGPAVAFTAAYDAAGRMIQETMPGGIIRDNTYDNAGQLVSSDYQGQVNGSPSMWLAWSQQRDVNGRIRREYTPNGSAFTDGTGGTGDALAYDRQYTYDPAGRLTEVDDRTATTPTMVLDPNSPTTGTTLCQRAYTFDRNGNRLGLNATGTCPTAHSTSPSWTHNAADQITNAGYTYDKLGRVTTIPAADTPAGATAGDLTLGYYDNDAARSIGQNGTTTTYTLDVSGRRATAATGPTNGSATSTLVRHYTDGSDNPGWVETTTGATTTVTRYAEALSGALGVEIDGNGAVLLALSNPHGDTVTTVTVPTTGPATAIGTWSDYDEYGNPTSPSASRPVGGTAGYSWLGNDQRGTDGSGLTLMGARLYNPTTGSFTSADPIYGGNASAYGYPADPVNSSDLSGVNRPGVSGGSV